MGARCGSKGVGEGKRHVPNHRCREPPAQLSFRRLLAVLRVAPLLDGEKQARVAGVTVHAHHCQGPCSGHVCAPPLTRVTRRVSRQSRGDVSVGCTQLGITQQCSRLQGAAQALLYGASTCEPGEPFQGPGADHAFFRQQQGARHLHDLPEPTDDRSSRRVRMRTHAHEWRRGGIGRQVFIRIPLRRGSAAWRGRGCRPPPRWWWGSRGRAWGRGTRRGRTASPGSGRSAPCRCVRWTIWVGLGLGLGGRYG